MIHVIYFGAADYEAGAAGTLAETVEQEPMVDKREAAPSTDCP